MSAPTAADRLHRLLAVLPLLADTEPIPFEDLERRAGVDPATVIADLRSITDRYDLPGGFVDPLGVDIEADRVAVRSSHFKRPTRLTIPELCALELGLAMLGAGTPPDERRPVDKARARLRDAIVTVPIPEPGDAWHAAPPLHGDDSLASLLRDAADTRSKVSIQYRGSADTSTVDRIVHPYAVFPSRGTWFVVAHCEHSSDRRLFRLDRIESASRIDKTFERPESMDLGDIPVGGRPFVSRNVPQTMRVRYSAAIARWIAEREGRSVDADGTITVEHPVSDADWAVRHVLQYGPEAEILSPLELRDELCRTLATMAQGDA